MATNAPSEQLIVPSGGFTPYPEVPQPNIFPMECGGVAQAAELYERSKRHVWNPSDFPGTCCGRDFTEEQRLGIMLLYGVLGELRRSGRRLRQGHDPCV